MSSSDTKRYIIRTVDGPEALCWLHENVLQQSCKTVSKKLRPDQGENSYSGVLGMVRILLRRNKSPNEPSCCCSTLLLELEGVYAWRGMQLTVLDRDHLNSSS